MTEYPHNPPSNSGGNSPDSTTQSRNLNTPTKRKQRIRGCGVPATVWFAPHPEDPSTEATPNPADQDEPLDWALAEIIRQFTTDDQNYLVTRLAHPGCLGENSSREHLPGSTPAEDPVTAANALIEARYALHLVIPAASEGDCGGARRRHGTTPGQAFLARLQHHIDDARGHLADGGTFAVLLPRPRPGAGFADDTGAAIQAVREGGFIYLQHIALVDAFIDHEGITPALPQADLDAFQSARTAGLPVHARSHSDLLIFRKPGKAELLD